MKYILVIITLILSLNLVIAMNGTGTINMSETNLTFNNITGDIEFSESDLFSTVGNLTITSNLNVSGFMFIERNCTTIEGNFTIKKISTGTERNVSGILDDAIQMTSYEGDFYKHPEFNIIESYVSYARMIASEEFLNESKCNKIYLGTRIEQEKIKRRFWFDKIITTYSPIVSYICEEKLNEVEYCE